MGGVMTIYLFTGTPGSGKSLHQAMNIHWALKLGKPVVANFEINDAAYSPGLFRFCDNSELSPGFLEDFALAYFADNADKLRKREGRIKLYLDECQLLFNSRDWNAKDRMRWVRFFSQHRKLGYDVYLVAQFDTMIDKQIRSLVEYEVKHRKFNNFGKVGSLLNAVMLGRAVCVGVTYWYGMRERLGSEFFLGRKRYYELYDTLKLFDAAPNEKEPPRD